jgi:hypothetical protein
MSRIASIASLLTLTLLAGTATAQTTATVAGGRLTVTTGNADQSAKVEMKSGPGVALLFGFQGIPDGTRFTGLTAVTVNTGSGFDKVEFDIESNQSWDIRLNTGAGSAETRVQWKLLPSPSLITASVTKSSLAGGVQLSSDEFDVETQNAQINLNTGSANEVNAKILADDPMNTLGLSFTSTGAKTNLEVASAANIVDIAARGTHSAPLNEVKYVINSLRGGAQARLFTDVTLGSGDDKFEGLLNNPTGTNTLRGTIRSGAGNDFVQVLADATSSVNGLTLQGGAGNDYLAIMIKNVMQLSQTLGTSILAGDGDDFLILTADIIRGTGLPNDVTSIIDGGTGFDLYNAFGIIRNCEGRL